MREAALASTERDVTSLTAHAGVTRALGAVAASDAETLADQCMLATIAAPTGSEGARAAHMADCLSGAGIRDVRLDDAGNVVARLVSPEPAEPVIVAAHLDTVFTEDVDVHVRRDGDRLVAPGIADNARGLAGMLAIARALVRADLRTARPLLLVATVGEEGAGDLRGVKHLFRPGGPARGAAAFIALDGGGAHQIVHRAVGSRRLRIEVRGPGGHSWTDRGTANPVNAVSHAVAALTSSHTAVSATLAVTRIGGGESVNAVPTSAWFEVDVRSKRTPALAAEDARVRDAIDRAVAAENEKRRPGTARLALDIFVIGDRPTGETPATSPIVRHACAATEHCGHTPELIAASTDANVAMALGVPAIAMGAGGQSGGAHTRAEWYANRGGADGLRRVLLTLLAVAGVAG